MVSPIGPKTQFESLSKVDALMAVRVLTSVLAKYLGRSFEAVLAWLGIAEFEGLWISVNVLPQMTSSYCHGYDNEPLPALSNCRHGEFCTNHHRLRRHIYLADFWLAAIIRHPPSITLDLSDHVCDEAIQGPWVYELWLVEDIWVTLQAPLHLRTNSLFTVWWVSIVRVQLLVNRFCTT